MYISGEMYIKTLPEQAERMMNMKKISVLANTVFYGVRDGKSRHFKVIRVRRIVLYYPFYRFFRFFYTDTIPPIQREEIWL